MPVLGAAVSGYLPLLRLEKALYAELEPQHLRELPPNLHELPPARAAGAAHRGAATGAAAQTSGAAIQAARRARRATQKAALEKRDAQQRLYIEILSLYLAKASERQGRGGKMFYEVREFKIFF